jgi:hypothetical protein
MRHFLGHLYRAMYRAKARQGWTALSPKELQDLGLQADFINLAKSGLSLNNLTYRKPTIIYRSDACEFGLGGYNLVSGRAWRWELPIELQNRTSINSLEFLSCLITFWVDASISHIQFEDCILSQSDSTSAAGWLRKSNFADGKDEFIQLSTARKLASLVIETRSCLYSQWFPGEENIVSDSLSRDFHLAASHLSFSLTSNFPDQAPFGLNILPLPSNIVSWATSLLQSQLQAELWSGAQTRSKFAHGLISRTTFGQIGITSDIYLDTFNRGQRHKILSAFAQAIREGRFSTQPSKSLKVDSIRASLDHVAQAFKLANRPDQCPDSNGKLAFLLQRQL